MSTIPVLTLDAFEVAGILHVDVRTLRRMVSRRKGWRGSRRASFSALLRAR